MRSEFSISIKDPIHNYIVLSKPEKNLLDSPFLQRLRWISQLSGVRMVFPGAHHSRLTHVLGVMYLAGEYAEQVYQDNDEKDHLIQIARIGGLLHDIAHGPFSHAYDDTIFRDIYPNTTHGHDVHRFLMIECDLLKPLIEDCGVSTDELKKLWEGEDRCLQAITQGVLGADRLDFMLRDAYFSGTTHFGSVDARRIISNSQIIERNGIPTLHYNLKVLDDIFQTLLGRFYMYRDVYFHKASSAADIIIRKMLQAAKDPLNLIKRTKNLEEYQWLNEYTLIGEIMSSNNAELKEAKFYCQRFLTRNLPKLIWESTIAEREIKNISGNLEKDSRTIAQGRIIDKIDEQAKKKGINKPQLYVTNTYPMSTIDYGEFDAGNIFVFDSSKSLEGKIKSFSIQEAIDHTTYFRSFLSQIKTGRERYVMIRVFADKRDASWIRDYLSSLTNNTSNASITETSY